MGYVEQHVAIIAASGAVAPAEILALQMQQEQKASLSEQLHQLPPLD
jgi:hypothetical protein